MRSTDLGRTRVCGILLAICLMCPVLQAQQGGDGGGLGGEFYTSNGPFAVPDADKIVPVRILREFELGPEVERFASSANRLLERRERELTDAVWKLDNGAVFTTTAILVRDVGQANARRLGARIDYLGKKGAADERSSHVVDLDELHQLEMNLVGMIRVMEQAPPRGESASLQYRCRSGFLISISLTSTNDGTTVSATVDKVTVTSRERARPLLEQTAELVRKIIRQLGTM